MGISEAKREANRANAKQSTGPVSDAGKARSSRNSTTHGILAAHIVIQDGDGAESQAETFCCGHIVRSPSVSLDGTWMAPI